MFVNNFILNREQIEEYCAPSLPMLDVIRHNHRLKGCKEACHAGDCGACLVLLGKPEQSRILYQPVVSCLLPIGAVTGHHVVTIEGLNGKSLNPIQRALVDQGAIQCGFCTPGIVLALTAFFLNGHCTDIDTAIDAVAGNLCRCTGYSGIKRAINLLFDQFDLATSPLNTRLRDCIAWGILPAYFADIPERLAALLPKQKANNQVEHALIVAGGTDLWVRRTNDLISRKLHFLRPIDRQDPICKEGDYVLIDPATSMEQLRNDSLMQNLLPTIHDDLQLIGSAPIRQRATVGGNLVNASPIGDISVIFLALNARLRLTDLRGERNVYLRDFFLAYKQTDCQRGERLQEIRFACLPGTLFSFEKVSKRTHLDIASVNSALSVRFNNHHIETVHLAAGGVAPIPLYLSATSEYLMGKPIRPDVIVKAAEIAQNEITPISDLRGSLEYKRLLLRQLMFAHFLKLFPRQLTWEALHANG